MALGARPDAIVRLLVTHSSRPVAVGTLVGVIAAAGLSLLLAAGVPEIDPGDPVSYLGVVVLIMIATVLATVLPARRAASITPVEALRAE